MAVGRALLQDPRAGRKACDLGRIRTRDIEAKPARDVHVGDMLHIRTEGGEFEVEVLALSEVRAPPALPRRSTAKPTPARNPASSRGRTQSHAAIRACSRTPAEQARPPPYHPVPRPLKSLPRKLGRKEPLTSGPCLTSHEATANSQAGRSFLHPGGIPGEATNMTRPGVPPQPVRGIVAVSHQSCLPVRISRKVHSYRAFQAPHRTTHPVPSHLPS